MFPPLQGPPISPTLKPFPLLVTPVTCFLFPRLLENFPQHYSCFQLSMASLSLPCSSLSPAINFSPLFHFSPFPLICSSCFHLSSVFLSLPCSNLSPSTHSHHLAYLSHPQAFPSTSHSYHLLPFFSRFPMDPRNSPPPHLPPGPQQQPLALTLKPQTAGYYEP